MEPFLLKLSINFRIVLNRNTKLRFLDQLLTEKCENTTLQETNPIKKDNRILNTIASRCGYLIFVTVHYIK